MPIGTDNPWTEESYIPGEKIREELKKFGQLKEATPPLGAGPAIYYQFPEALGTIGLITPLSRHFCPTCNRLRITADGKLRLCLFSNQEIDLKKKIRDGASLEEISQLIQTALKEKPLRHDITEKSKRSMAQIGG